MRVTVKSLQGQEYRVDIENDHSVSQLKESIGQLANGLPVDRQKLVYKGRTMQDTSLIKEYNLEQDCKIHLIVQRVADKPGEAMPKSPDSSRSTITSHPLTSAPTSSSSSNQRPMDGLESSRSNEEMIRMLGQWGAAAGPRSPDRLNVHSGRSEINTGVDGPRSSGIQVKENRFTKILRERLASHFPPHAVDKIIESFYREIDVDINTSSLDDLERLAKQKLHITSE